ncbi:MAG TPA: serine/threonine-protein kinase [Candidatus Sulfotelmatobacter sp.]|nr:serine/threonine-protein kinase [Candidatus Sulfotelmatobacter sp.]
MENSETKQFGRYEILSELGRGAMGVVYKARDPQIDRLVALKTVSLWGQEPDEEKEFRLRFMNEAQAAGRLHHSGIVSVFDVGENPENRDPYIVLEYVQGESLNRILSREKKLSLERSLKLAEEIADALDYAHAQGVIHRDIKPANILITQDGRAKIADFGIAKLNLAHFTVPGRVLGTPAYMAPEQLSGEGVDGRSDLFSLGVILYAMVTGHSPFQGTSATTVCFKVANREPIAASALDMTLPPQLDAVISRAMAKDPNERYQRGSDFADDLRILQQSYQITSSTTSRRTSTSTATRSALTGSTSAMGPAANMAAAGETVRDILSKARIRDLILGAATVALLVIVAVQLKLFNNRPESSRGAAQVNSAATVNLDSALPGQPVVQVEPVPPAAPVPTVVHKVPAVVHKTKTPVAKTPPIPPKQIVVPSSTLELGVQHQFKDATLYVWVDDKLTLTLPLHGAAQKKLVVFNGVRGITSETMKIPAGKRMLRFRALSTDQAVDLSKTLSAEFVGGDTKSLSVSFEKRNSSMRLSWQ